MRMDRALTSMHLWCLLVTLRWQAQRLTMPWHMSSCGNLLHVTNPCDMLHIGACWPRVRLTEASVLYLQAAIGGGKQESSGDTAVAQPPPTTSPPEDAGATQQAEPVTDLALQPTVHDIVAACLRVQPGAGCLPFKLAHVPPAVHVQHTAPLDAEALLHTATQQQGDV
jgi:hypothetical protein